MPKLVRITLVTFVFLCVLQIICFLLIQYENSFFNYVSYYAKLSGKFNSTSTLNSFSNTKLQELERELQARLRIASREKITILMWDLSPGNVDLRSPDRNNCGYCEVVSNKSMVNHPSTKAVVFHYSELAWTRLPSHRRPDQFYVWMSLEPLSMLRLFISSIRKYDDVFNLTFSYRLDADVWHPYRTVKELKRRMGKTPHAIEDLVKKKRKLAVWIVSNCDRSQGAIERLKFAKSLARDGLNIDLGGRCFPDGIKDFKFAEYKFYFSFENSLHCKDYITEKFFNNALIHGNVPVVFGTNKKDYELIAPPNSFIYAKDYTNKELIDLLNYLDKNDTAFKQYLKWIEHPFTIPSMPLNSSATSECQLCRYLHGINVDRLFSRNVDSSDEFPVFSAGPIPNTIPSLMEWLFGHENKQCVDNFLQFYTKWREATVLRWYYSFSFALIILICVFFYITLSLTMRGKDSISCRSCICS